MMACGRTASPTAVGRYKFADGCLYVGVFKDGSTMAKAKHNTRAVLYTEATGASASRMARGKMTYHTGQIYDGQWKEGKSMGRYAHPTVGRYLCRRLVPREISRARRTHITDYWI